MSDVVWLKQLKEADQSRRVYRVDKFVVPQAARPEFLAKIRETHAMLATLPGFVRDVVLEQCGGPGEFNLVTLVEWESAAALLQHDIADEAGQGRQHRVGLADLGQELRPRGLGHHEFIDAVNSPRLIRLFKLLEPHDIRHDGLPTVAIRALRP
ncbi:antibiotic biosynthesis monooxygenase family protein [Oleomonas cavernae]|uniref:antibiotic biosynthesis monooxygenase family protein n=1 Tax=Oleomonas cavernae TaxID=2320859 RepID=UPI0013148269|nr:antibiotic biosynthesis monooxygenase [Oleomonas cavernae]